MPPPPTTHSTALFTLVLLSISCQQPKQPTDTVTDATSQSMADSLTKPTKTMNDIPLEQVKGWSPAHVAQLKKAWITTADQVVAISVTPGGIRSLSEQLQISEAETRQLVGAAQQMLPADRRAELSRPADTSQYGRGANPPKGPDVPE